MHLAHRFWLTFDHEVVVCRELLIVCLWILLIIRPSRVTISRSNRIVVSMPNDSRVDALNQLKAGEGSRGVLAAIELRGLVCQIKSLDHTCPLILMVWGLRCLNMTECSILKGRWIGKFYYSGLLTLRAWNHESVLHRAIPLLQRALKQLFYFFDVL